MNFLIAGLGNVGEEYLDTRHNVGFKIADALALQHNSTWVLDRNAHYAAYRSRGKNIHLIKPTTYMNLSGKAVRFWLQQLNVPVQHLLVVLDDLALPFGTIRIRSKGSDGGHNGLKDIDSMLGHQNYPRLRFGIGSEFAKGRQVDYVLGRWSVEETKELPKLIDTACDGVNSVLFEGIAQAMTKYNK